MAGKKKSFVVYATLEDQLNMMTDAQAGQLFRSLFVFNRGEEPVFTDPAVQMAFYFVRPVMEDNRAKYEARCGINAEVAKNRWNRVKEEIRQETQEGDTTKYEKVRNVPEYENKKYEFESEKNDIDSVNDSVLKKEINKEKKEITQADDDAVANAVVFFRENVNKRLSKANERELMLYASRYGEKLLIEAMNIAITNAKRSWGYVRGILDNWAANGKPSPTRSRNRSVASTTGLVPSRPKTPEEEAQDAREREESLRQMQEMLGYGN